MKFSKLAPSGRASQCTNETGHVLVNPYSQRSQRHRWIWPPDEANTREAAKRQALQRELLEIGRELDELKREFAARRAARLKEAEALRRKSDLAWDQFFGTFKRYAAQQKAGFNPDQPRVPAGNPGAGEWTDGATSAAKPKRTRLAGDITGFTKHGINQAITRGVYLQPCMTR
jgi:hypothetical protein